MTLILIHDINIIGDIMINVTDEEIKAYVDKIEHTSVTNLNSVLPRYDVYNADIIMSRICDALAENINILRRLNIEGGTHELDAEIRDLLRKVFICNQYLSKKNVSKHSERSIQHRLVFAKTPAGRPYFTYDLGKVPREAYGEVKKTLDEILYGVDKSDNSKVKYYAGADLPKKVLEFKGFQVRIFTTKIKGNTLCIFGLSIKKANNDKKISENIRSRLSSINGQIDQLKMLFNDPIKKQEILDESQVILDDVMRTLGGDEFNGSGDVELLFPSDEELETLVPFDDSSVAIDIETKSETNDSDESKNYLIEQETSINVIPHSSKKVKRRGLGKKTIARNKIIESLKGFSLEELMEVQDFITKLKLDKQLNDSISSMYDNFMNMSDEQIREFENSIKYFKHDEVGRHK